MAIHDGFAAAGMCRAKSPRNQVLGHIPTPWGCKAAAGGVRPSHSVTGHFLFTARGRRFGATRLRSGYWRPPKSLAHPTRRCLANGGSAHEPGRQAGSSFLFTRLRAGGTCCPTRMPRRPRNAASTTAPTIRGRDSPCSGGWRETAGDRHDCGRRLAGGRGRSPGPSRPGSRPALILPPRATTGPPRWPGAVVTVGRFSSARTLGARGTSSGRSRSARDYPGLPPGGWRLGFQRRWHVIWQHTNSAKAFCRWSRF